MEEEEMKHTFVPTNGISLHIAQLGSGPVVLLLHGFPEIWYSWRHQLRALAQAGFRAIAPDFRGYGLTGENPEPSKNSFSDLVDDVVGLLDALGEEQVYVVAKDFGAFVAYTLALLHPQRVKAMVVMGVAYFRPEILSVVLDNLPEGLYMKRFTEPGRPEADFARFDVATVIKRIYIMFCNSKMPLAPDDKETLDLVDDAAPLPEWLTEDDLQAYAELYANSGFGSAMEVPYRCFPRSALKLLGREDHTIAVPVLFVIGKKDYAVDMLPLDQIIPAMKADIPRLETVEIEEGTHFVQEQMPQQVNDLIVQYFSQAHN